MLVSNRSLFPSSKRQQPISIFLTWKTGNESQAPKRGSGEHGAKY